jgi:hypothetical protein
VRAALARRRDGPAGASPGTRPAPGGCGAGPRRPAPTAGRETRERAAGRTRRRPPHPARPDR